MGALQHASRNLVRCDWRRSTSRDTGVHDEVALDDLLAVIARAIADEHREFTCTGPTRRRTSAVGAHAFFHPVSVDLVNGDDPGGGLTMSKKRSPLVCVMLDALDASGSPFSYYDQEQQAAPTSRAEYERHLPAERADAMLQRATELNHGVGVDRWRYDPAEAKARPALLERAWCFDMCQVFNMAACLALRAYLHERRAALRLPGRLGGGRVRCDGLRIVQGAPPPPAEGVDLAFVYRCAERGIGLKGARLMGASHLWMELVPEAAASCAARAVVSVDFAAQQFGLGRSLGGRREGALRAWVLTEAADEEAGVLQPAQWRADADLMARLDRQGARGCGLERCAQCAGRVFGPAGSPRRAHEGERDPLSELLPTLKCHGRDAPLSEEAPPSDRDRYRSTTHACRPLRAALLGALRRWGRSEG